jgi:hypothetical protein
MRVLIGVIAEKQGAPRQFGQGFSRFEALKVDRVENHLRPFCRYRMILYQPIKAVMIHCGIATDSGEPGRSVMPSRSIVTNKNCRYPHKVEQGGHCGQIVMSMNQVWRWVDGTQAVRHYYPGCLQSLGSAAESWSIDNWHVSSSG